MYVVNEGSVLAATAVGAYGVGYIVFKLLYAAATAAAALVSAAR